MVVMFMGLSVGGVVCMANVGDRKKHKLLEARASYKAEVTFRAKTFVVPEASIAEARGIGSDGAE